MRHVLAGMLAAALCDGSSWSANAQETRATEPAGGSAVAETVYAHGVVAADHPLASQAGVEILRQGGNVIDAAVATAFTLSVVRPASSGIGGGGFLLFWNAEKQQAVAIDYRETAPAAARREMFFDPDDPKRAHADLSRYGPLAVALPTHVAGLCHALEKYGTLSPRQVLAPALRICREGYEIDLHDREVQQEVLEDFEKRPEFKQRYATLYRRYLNAGRPWSVDQKFHSPLGNALERIATDGAAGFYRGLVAEALVAEIQRGGGLITLADLAAVRPTVRTPLSRQFSGGALFTMPPPSSGGVALLETLDLLERVDARFPDLRLATLSPHAPQRLHLLTEAFKHAFADRATYLGDADFADVPLQKLLSPAHLAELAGRIDPARTQPQDRYGKFSLKDDGGTTHFSIIDAAGNAVACTETINTAFGSYVVEPEFGIILNNEMDDFTAHPDTPNAFGLTQSEANSVAAGKRPLSSMTPTILVRDGRAALALGASGGPRIITATAQVLLHMTQDDLSPAQAVRQPRLHHQWLPHRLELERGFDPSVAKGLAAFGHDVRLIDDSAVVQAVARRADGLRGASDARKHGKAAGY